MIFSLLARDWLSYWFSDWRISIRFSGEKKKYDDRLFGYDPWLSFYWFGTGDTFSIPRKVSLGDGLHKICVIAW